MDFSTYEQEFTFKGRQYYSHVYGGGDASLPYITYAQTKSISTIHTVKY